MASDDRDQGMMGPDESVELTAQLAAVELEVAALYEWLAACFAEKRGLF